MHIYQGPLLQVTIDLWNTTTPHKFNIVQNAHIPRADVPPLTLVVYSPTTPECRYILVRCILPNQLYCYIGLLHQNADRARSECTHVTYPPAKQP